MQVTPTGVGRARGRRPFAGWAVALVGLVALGLSGRLLDPGSARDGSRPAADGGRPATAASPATGAGGSSSTVRLARESDHFSDVRLGPWPGVHRWPMAVVEVSGRTRLRVVRVTAETASRELGRGTLASSPDGRFSGSIRIVPPAMRADGFLRLSERHGGGALGLIRFVVKPRFPIMLWAPTPGARVARRSLDVSGLVRRPHRAVEVRLSGSDGRMVARGRAAARPLDETWASFELRLTLAREPRDWLTLEVWRDLERVAESGGLRIKLAPRRQP